MLAPYNHGTPRNVKLLFILVEFLVDAASQPYFDTNCQCQYALTAEGLFSSTVKLQVARFI